MITILASVFFKIKKIMRKKQPTLHQFSCLSNIQTRLLFKCKLSAKIMFRYILLKS